nr:hypothetical protein GCM10020063_001240 [Dactylosporangium thailandense]
MINHARNGFFVFRPGEGYEYVMVLAAAGMGLAGTGPGRISFDRLIGIEDPRRPGLLTGPAGRNRGRGASSWRCAGDRTGRTRDGRQPRQEPGYHSSLLITDFMTSLVPP